MRAQQLCLAALAITLSLATVVNGENPFGHHLSHAEEHDGHPAIPAAEKAAMARRAQARKLIERRSLLSECAMKFPTCGLGGTSYYYGSCGAFTTKDDSKWCTLEGQEFCCGTSEDDCCPPNGGAIAGLVIGIVVVLAASITACAYCCKCCCFKPKEPAQTTVIMGQAPVGQVPMQPMQQVQYAPK